MRFEFATATRILLGPGVAAEAGALAADLGRRALLVTGRTPARAARVRDALATAGVAVVPFAVAGEPTVDDARAAVAAARDGGCDLVVACGGGSALDAGKAVAMLLANRGDPLEFLEVVGRGRPIGRPSAPFLAIPTTAGTGSEVTRNAVLASPEHGVKASLRSPHMLPRVALVDPDLAAGLPPDVTAATGMDAFTQLLEPFVGVRANPLTDALCREGLARSARSLRRAVADGADDAARLDLAVASLFGGLALANAGLGAVHGVAAVVGGRFAAPHGAVCARLLAPVTSANVAALRTRDPRGPALARYAEAARLLTGVADAGPGDLVAALQALCRDLRIPPLAAWGVAAADVAALADGASRASSTKGNPVVLTAPELAAAIEAAL
jgi:alcohol dehydrogenase class IV